MRRYLMIFIVAVHIAAAYAGSGTDCGYVVMSDDMKADSAIAERIMEAAAALPDGESVPLFIARRLIGVPYVGHTLDRDSVERLVVNLRELDCMTLVDNVVAMTRCVEEGRRTFADFVLMLAKVRYRNGDVAYENRLHYYQWWVTDNDRMGLVKEINAPNPPFSAVQTLKINYMSENSGSYDMLRGNSERVVAIKRLEDATNGTKVCYIPKAGVVNTDLLRSTIHDGDIIAIVTGKYNLDTAHLGFAVWHKDGLHLLNASSIHKKVVEEPMTLYRYLHRANSRIGIRIAQVL